MRGWQSRSASKIVSRHLQAGWAITDDDDEANEREEGRSYWGNEGAGILFRTPTRVLLLHRSRSVNEPNTWGAAGGAVEAGENTLQSALRECVEELGSVPSHKIVGKYVYKDGDFKYTTFIAMVDEDAVTSWRIRLNWENQGWEWIENGEAKSHRLHFGVKPVLAQIGWR